MKLEVFILIIVIMCICVIFYKKVYNFNMVYVKSDMDGNEYLVQNTPDKNQAANTLAKIKKNIITLSDKLYADIDLPQNKKYAQYIIRLHERVRGIILIESEQDSIYTSYSINKGEQIIFCLRSRKITSMNNLHDINLMMYVVLHEISHVACPIYDNHGPLFRDIFGFITKSAVAIGLYRRINFSVDRPEYCGLTITDSII